MLKKVAVPLLYCFALITVSCHEKVKSKKIIFEVVSDSLYNRDKVYEQDFGQWRKVYENCMNHQLFSNAGYLGLQGRVRVGSINNKSATNVNDKISVIDTTFSKKFYDLVSFIGSSNCYAKISLTPSLKNEFYAELVRVLNQSKQYKYLLDYIDTAHILFKITTLAENSIRPDSLASILQRTKDTTLLEFKKLLVTPGNAILIRDAIIFGFYAEFSLSKELPVADQNNFKKEAFLNLDNNSASRIVNESGSIKLLNNNHLMININKYYTVLGSFYVYKEIDN